VGGGQGSKRAERSQETKSSEDGEAEEPAFTQQTKKKSQRKRREMLQNRKENEEKGLGRGGGWKPSTHKGGRDHSLGDMRQFSEKR